MAKFAESVVEEAALDWLGELGYAVLHGPDIAPGEVQAERQDYDQVVLEDRLRQALANLNPDLPADAVEEAFRKTTRVDGPTLETRNRALHKMLVDGVTVEYRTEDGGVRGDQARILDFDDPDGNDWLAVNQLTVTGGGHGKVKINRRPDVVLYVNGLPLAVIELKNAADEKATVWTAYKQLQTYKGEIPNLFTYNAALVVSDGLQARMGTITSSKERFMPWRTVTGRELAPPTASELKVLLDGVFDKRRFLDLVRHFIVFEESHGGALAKKMAGYHQYHAVNVAVEETLRAARAVSDRGVAEKPGRYEAGLKPGGDPGDRRVGVVWHTQGSGKSLTMAFYAGRVILHPEMGNPTVVVLTDRNDLDDQLYGTFSRCKDLLRQPPDQAESRTDLREKLRVDAGGVVFTTIQKFFPETKGDSHPLLSDRRNIVVIADEAHRSQYDFIDGYARHMRDALPNASFIGFTGTPIELTDKNTRAVFGDYISVYDIQRAVEDKATVPIYYESRLARLALDEAEKPQIDPEFDEATEGEEIERKEKLKTRWAQLEAVVGTGKRVGIIARDLVDHFERRCEAMEGKAMVVCMSRRICMDLYDAIVALKPEWHDDADDKGAIKVVMTGGAAEGPRVASHARNKPRREELAKRFRDPEDPFKIVIVRDMWLTGFDSPCLHTMYVDKPMRGHGLMQTIARVNRVFRDKPGGLIVDYLGLADELRLALKTYTQSGGTGKTAIDQEDAVRALKEKYEVCRDLFHGFDRSAWTEGKPAEKLGILPPAQEHVLAQEDGKARTIRAVTQLSQAFALAVPHEYTTEIRDDVAFFQAVKSALVKRINGEPRSDEDLNQAIRQIVSKAVATEEVVDIFSAAGLKKPDISILEDKFLEEVRDLPHKNLAVELLQRLLSGEVKAKARRNVVQARSFSEMLENTIRRYHNRAIETQEVIEELIDLGTDMRKAHRRGENLGLNDDELAFYDALETNDSAVKVLGEPKLKKIARELVDKVRKNVTIDWTVRENVRAKLRVMVKRILNRYGYPPDKREQATLTVLEQAEVLSEGWAEAA